MNKQDSARALMLSPASYNAKTGLMLWCPLTSRIKGYPFEVRIAGERDNVALSDQVKSLDWGACKAQRKERAAAAELPEVRARAIALIGAE